MRESNPQLDIYGLAGVREYSIAYDFKTVRTVIVQPRLNHVSERVQTVDELEHFAVDVAAAAMETFNPDAPLVPSVKACRWCKAKATCPAIQAEALASFEDLTAPAEATEDKLAVAMSKADLIEGWVKAIRAEVERRLLSNVPVPGYKLVQGKRGNRAWKSEEVAEAALKAMRVKHDQMYSYKVISPTQAEKLAEAEVIGKRQWPKLKELITQSEGKPSVAPESDKRPALVLDTTAGFADLTAAPVL